MKRKIIWRYLLMSCLFIVPITGCTPSDDNPSSKTSLGSSINSSETLSSSDSEGSVASQAEESSSSKTSPSSKSSSTSITRSQASSGTTSTIKYNDVKAGVYNPNVSPNMTGTLDISMGKVINKNIIGGGVNFLYSSYLFANFSSGSEWSLQIPLFPGSSEMEDKEWDNFFKLMDFSGMQYVRLAVSLSMWEPINDNGSANSTDFDKGFVFSPNFKKRPEAATVPEDTYLYMQKLYKLLDYFEKKGIYVCLANWNRGLGQFCPNNSNWLAKKKPDGSDYGMDYAGSLEVTSVDEYAESLAAIMYHLQKEKKYTCVKAFSYWNEPEHFKNFESTMNEIHIACDKQLRRLGIRNSVKIFGCAGGWTMENGHDSKQVGRIISASGQGIDAVVDHSYVAAMDFDFNYSNRQKSLTQWGLDIQNTLKTITTDRERWYFVDEVGMQPEANQVGSLYKTRLHLAESHIVGYNSGAKGLAAWVFNETRDTTVEKGSPFSLVLLDDLRFHFLPEKTNYYPSALIMKYIKQGSDIVNTTVTGFKDSKGYQRVRATVAKKNADVTVLLVNDSKEPVKVTVKGLDGGKTYKVHYVANGKTDRIYPGLNFAPSNNNIIALHPESITVLTTYTYGTQTVR